MVMILCCFGILGYISATNNPHDATTRTQIVQGIIGLLMMIGGYYYGAAKNRPAQANTGSGDINVNTPPEPPTTA